MHTTCTGCSKVAPFMTGVISMVPGGMVKLSIKLFIAGLIVQTFLMNAIGFFGAIFAATISKDMTGGREILYASQPYGILSGVLFALSIYYFSKIDDRYSGEKSLNDLSK